MNDGAKQGCAIGAGCIGAILVMWLFVWLLCVAGCGAAGQAAKRAREYVKRDTYYDRVGGTAVSVSSVTQLGPNRWRVAGKYCGISPSSVNKVEWQAAGRGELNRDFSVTVHRVPAGETFWVESWRAREPPYRVSGPRWVATQTPDRSGPVKAKELF